MNLKSMIRGDGATTLYFFCQFHHTLSILFVKVEFANAQLYQLHVHIVLFSELVTFTRQGSVSVIGLVPIKIEILIDCLG